MKELANTSRFLKTPHFVGGASGHAGCNGIRTESKRFILRIHARHGVSMMKIVGGIFLLLSVLACQNTSTSKEWSPQCETFFASVKEACQETIAQKNPLLCEGSKFGQQRLLDLGPQDFTEGCRIANESLTRSLNTALEREK